MKNWRVYTHEAQELNHLCKNMPKRPDPPPVFYVSREVLLGVKCYVSREEKIHCIVIVPPSLRSLPQE